MPTTTSQCCSHLNYAFFLPVSILILDKLTSDIPGCTVNTTKWSHISDIMLADPVCKPVRIDCRLGRNVDNDTILEGVVRGPPGTPLAQAINWVGC